MSSTSTQLTTTSTCTRLHVLKNVYSSTCTLKIYSSTCTWKHARIVTRVHVLGNAYSRLHVM